MNIFVYGEAIQGALTGPTKECLGEATRLGGEPILVLVGSNEAALEDARKTSLSKIIVAKNEALADYHAEHYVAALDQVLNDNACDLLLFPATTRAREVAARLAARRQTACASECLGLAIEGETVKAKRPMYTGKVIATVALSGSKPVMATIRPNVVKPIEPGSCEQVVEVQVTDLGDVGTVLKSCQEKAGAGGKVELTEAPVVVAGGRGVKGPEHFPMLQETADLFKGAVGASRMVVDNGWLDYNLQIGQTGKVVTPSLYFAVGISGAIQHVVGMQNSQCIVAINNNPDAPIFKIANYGIVGDLFEVMPVLNEKIKEKNVRLV